MNVNGSIPSAADRGEMACPEHANDPAFCSALIKCPYSEEHHVSPKLFAQHLRECRRDYCTRNASSIQYVRCKLNSRHHVPEIELAFHEKHCDDYLFSKVMGEIQRKPIEVPVASSDDSSSESDSDDDSSSSESTVTSSSSSASTSEECSYRGEEDV